MLTLTPPALDLFSVRSDRSRLRPHEILLRRAIHLPPEDQSLLRLALEGRSFRHLARIFGSSPGVLCRRVSRLLERLRHPVISAICDAPASLPGAYRRVGLQWFLLRHTLRHIAADNQQSIHQIRGILASLVAYAHLAEFARPQSCARPRRARITA